MKTKKSIPLESFCRDSELVHTLSSSPQNLNSYLKAEKQSVDQIDLISECKAPHLIRSSSKIKKEYKILPFSSSGAFFPPSTEQDSSYKFYLDGEEEESSNRLNIKKPSSRQIEGFSSQFEYLYFKNAHANAKSKYEFDLLNLKAYIENWDVLDHELQKTLVRFIDSDLSNNGLKQGLKEKYDFVSHLLLLCGAEIWNIRSFKNTNMVLSNLRNLYGKYPREISKNNIIDARSCRQRFFKFNKIYDLERLFAENNCQIVNFELDSGYCEISELNALKRDQVWNFFRTNLKILKRFQRSRLINSYLYSHEVSVDSILNLRFRPHTHAIVFFPKGGEPPLLADRLKENGRTLKIMPDVHERFSTVEKFVPYLFAAYSPATVYKKEYRDSNVLKLNRNLVRTLHTLLELGKGDANSRSVQRNNHSCIPKRAESKRRAKGGGVRG